MKLNMIDGVARAAALLTHTVENVEGSLLAGGGKEEEEEEVGAPEGPRDQTSGSRSIVTTH